MLLRSSPSPESNRFGPQASWSCAVAASRRGSFALERPYTAEPTPAPHGHNSYGRSGSMLLSWSWPPVPFVPGPLAAVPTVGGLLRELRWAAADPETRSRHYRHRD